MMKKKTKTENEYYEIKKTRYEKELERGALFEEILTAIIDHGFTKRKEVCDFFEGKPEYISLISSRPAFAFIRELLKENWREQNPEGKVIKVKLIEKDEVK